MSIILTYDAISGEKTRGTLRMVMSRPVSRIAFLWSKYLSAYVVLLVPLFIGTLASLLTVVFSEKIRLEGIDFVKSLAAFLVIALFLSFTILLGLAASVVAYDLLVSTLCNAEGAKSIIYSAHMKLTKNRKSIKVCKTASWYFSLEHMYWP